MYAINTYNLFDLSLHCLFAALCLLCVFPLIQTSNIKNINSDYYYLFCCFTSI